MRQGKFNLVLRQQMGMGFIRDPTDRQRPEKMSTPEILEEITQNESHLPDIIPSFGYHQSSCEYYSRLENRQKDLYSELEKRTKD